MRHCAEADATCHIGDLDLKSLRREVSGRRLGSLQAQNKPNGFPFDPLLV